MLKTFAKVEDGIVTNIAIAEGVWPFADDPYIEAPGGVSVGWGYSDGQFSDLAPPASSSAIQPISTGLQTL